MSTWKYGDFAESNSKKREIEWERGEEGISEWSKDKKGIEFSRVNQEKMIILLLY